MYFGNIERVKFHKDPMQPLDNNQRLAQFRQRYHSFATVQFNGHFIFTDSHPVARYENAGADNAQ